MKFTVTQHDLSNAMQFVASAIERKSTMDIMTNVLITTDMDSITLSGTNTEVEKRITIPAQVDEQGSITVPAAKLSDFAKNADKDKDIKFTLKDTKGIINSGKSRWSLSTLSADIYPEFMSVEESQSLSVEITKLIDAISRCSPTMAQKDVRYYLNGMLFDVKDGKLTVVATDGHRLSCYSMDTDAEFERQAIIPRSAVLDILKMITKAPDAKIIIGRDNVKVTVGNMVMYTKLIDGKFPDYKRVIPSDLTINADMNTEELRNSVKRTLPLSNQYFATEFVFNDGQLTINATNTNQEKAVEEIPVSKSGDDISIGFNGMYVSDLLGSIDSENVVFQMKDSGSSALVEDGDFIGVLMPLRI